MSVINSKYVLHSRGFRSRLFIFSKTRLHLVEFEYICHFCSPAPSFVLSQFSHWLTVDTNGIIRREKGLRVCDVIVVFGFFSVSRTRNCQPKSTEEESSPDVFENGPVTRRRARRLYSNSTTIKTELLNGVNEGESPLSADTNKSINSTNHRSPPLKKKRLSVDMTVRRRGRPRTRDIQSKHFNHSSASPRRSKREKRLIYRNLSARSIEKEVFKPPILVDSDGSDTVDPYEKILSPHHRIQLKTDIPTGSPVQMLTRRQRRLLGAGLEQPTDESTPLKVCACLVVVVVL